MSIDERFIKALHVETLRKEDLHAEREPHVIFQTSTIDALLDGAYDGEVTFGQLRDHGDFGLGTFEACDGEMIAVEGGVLPRHRWMAASPQCPIQRGRRSRL